MTGENHFSFALMNLYVYLKTGSNWPAGEYQMNTDKQNALRRECTFKIEIVLKMGVAGVNIY